MSDSMSDCGCEKAKAELEEYLHNELSGADAAEVREHMEHCAGCADEHKVRRMLMEVVQRACVEVAPEQLRAQVLQRLREITSEGSRSTH